MGNLLPVGSRSLRRWTATATVVLCLFPLVVRALPPGSTPRELELGAEAAKDIANSVQFVTDPTQLAKLQAILDEIRKVTPRPEIQYLPHIVATPVINAFVIPGGYVYVTTGLLSSVESDDELAGVLAHEIAHNVQQHAIQRMNSAPKGLGLLQLAAIAALIIGKSPEAAVLANTAANAVTAAVLKGGSIEAEEEADACGIGYLVHTKYNPTGFLTFLERLASSSGKFFEEEMGIYQTHPLTRDRVHSARGQLEELNVPILRRLVLRVPQPEAHPINVEGSSATDITYQGERLFVLAGQDSARSAAALATVSWVLDRELQTSDIKIIPAEGGVLFSPGSG
ncbi:MAG TPA: M48 family metalloprotease, partial [bacterium]|nr:M48 family metalloprotease [bacterium]